MVKQNLEIEIVNSSPLAYGFSRILNLKPASFNLDERKINLSTRCDECDIKFNRPFMVPDEIWYVDERKLGTYKELHIRQYTTGKNGNEQITTPLFEGNTLVKNIPTTWFKWNPVNESFMDIYHRTLRDIPPSMADDVITNGTGHVLTVLRPNNLTHAILAFIVTDPELFRFALFDIIVDEVKLINERRAKGMYIKTFKKSLKEKIAQCGLVAISETTFGQEGVYGDKFMEPYMWALTPYIAGKDIRVIKAGNRFFSHVGWHDMKKQGAKIINPDEHFADDSIFCREVSKIMDNCITPVGGSMDLRLHPNGTYYFLETSHCYSSERYPEWFAQLTREAILKQVITKHDELIGNHNDGWEARYVELRKQAEESSDDKVWDVTEVAAIKDFEKTEQKLAEGS